MESKKSFYQKTISYFWFHPPVLQGPFTRWVNNKLKLYTSHLYLIHSIILKSTLLYPISQNALRSWWQQPLGKTWVLQCQNGAMTHISRKTKSCRQHALFLWSVKLMLWISNLFFHLIQITCFQKILMAYLQTCRSRGKICSHFKKRLRIHSFNILFLYTNLSNQTNTYLKKFYWKSIDFFKKMV